MKYQCVYVYISCVLNFLFSLSQASVVNLTGGVGGVWQACVVTVVRAVSSPEGDSGVSVLQEVMRSPTALSPPDPSRQNHS